MSIKDRFDLVIFDWAGTMVDFGCEAPVKALIEAFAAEGVALDAATARRDMGKSKNDHVELPAARTGGRGRLARPPRPRAAAGRRRVCSWRGSWALMREHAARASTLIPGARATFDRLRAAGLRVASSTGYTREMMQPVLARAAEQGYTPEHLVCIGRDTAGRPSPLMIYKACAELGVWPLSRVVKVDDAEVGIAEGKAAGAFTVGVASGNALGPVARGIAGAAAARARARIEAAARACVRRRRRPGDRFGRRPGTGARAGGAASAR